MLYDCRLIKRALPDKPKNYPTLPSSQTRMLSRTLTHSRVSWLHFWVSFWVEKDFGFVVFGFVFDFFWWWKWRARFEIGKGNGATTRRTQRTRDICFEVGVLMNPSCCCCCCAAPCYCVVVIVRQLAALWIPSIILDHKLTAPFSVELQGCCSPSWKQ